LFNDEPENVERVYVTLEFGILTEVVETIVDGFSRQVEIFPFFVYANLLVCVKMAAYSETHKYVHFPTRPLDHILILLSLQFRLVTFMLCRGCQDKILCPFLNFPIVPTTLSLLMHLLRKY